MSSFDSPVMRKQLITYLSSHITTARYERFCAVAAQRTRHMSLVLENIYQPHNASAVVRTTELFGIQDLHVIQSKYPFAARHGVALGSAQWINIHKHASMATCYDQLKSQGYRVVAAALKEDATPLYELDVSTPIAVVFGTERYGISPEALARADEYMIIPMRGFTQSYNISVSVALTMQHVIRTLQHSSVQWLLTADEQEELILEWLRTTLPSADKLEADFAQSLIEKI